MRHGLSSSGVALALAAWVVSCSASDDGVWAPSGGPSGGAAGVGGGFSPGTGGSSSGIASGGIARWQVPVVHTPAQVSARTTIGELLAANRAYLAKGRAIIDYAEALKGSAESRALLTEANELAAAADPGGTDPELREIRELVGLALTLY
jgi:hypothetical protein